MSTERSTESERSIPSIQLRSVILCRDILFYVATVHSRFVWWRFFFPLFWFSAYLSPLQRYSWIFVSHLLPVCSDADVDTNCIWVLLLFVWLTSSVFRSGSSVWGLLSSGEVPFRKKNCRCGDCEVSGELALPLMKYGTMAVFPIMHHCTSSLSFSLWLPSSPVEWGYSTVCAEHNRCSIGVISRNSVRLQSLWARTNCLWPDDTWTAHYVWCVDGTFSCEVVVSVSGIISTAVQKHPLCCHLWSIRSS